MRPKRLFKSPAARLVPELSIRAPAELAGIVKFCHAVYPALDKQPARGDVRATLEYLLRLDAAEQKARLLEVDETVAALLAAAARRQYRYAVVTADALSEHPAPIRNKIIEVALQNLNRQQRRQSGRSLRGPRPLGEVDLLFVEVLHDYYLRHHGRGKATAWIKKRTPSPFLKFLRWHFKDAGRPLSHEALRKLVLKARRRARSNAT